VTNFIPIFPLQIVVFPGENLNLHIFEPRYKQLVNECLLRKKPFGIPVVVDGKMKDHGTLVNIWEVKEIYENGDMDIKTKAAEVFSIIEIIKEIPEKLFSGAIVNYPHNNYSGNAALMKILIDDMRLLHELLQITKKYDIPDEALSTYDIAHHSGLTLAQEYELLQLTNERQRQQYMKNHFDKILPVVKEMESLKERIKQNGHFKMPGGPT
jgi:uncharacterized protein